jgi:hypothetical protein
MTDERVSVRSLRLPFDRRDLLRYATAELG